MRVHPVQEQYDPCGKSLIPIYKMLNLHRLEALKVKYLGKKGPIQNLMKSLKDATPEQRPQLGKLINDLKEEITPPRDPNHRINPHQPRRNQTA